MKKTLITVGIALLIGSFFGYFMFDNLNETIDSAFYSYEELTFFQTGVFTRKENALEASKKYNSSTIVQDGDIYRVYIAILNNEENIKTMKEYFDSKSIKYYLKKENVRKENYIEEIKKYERLLLQSEEKDTFDAINKQILKTYEEGADKV